MYAGPDSAEAYWQTVHAKILSAAPSNPSSFRVTADVARKLQEERMAQEEYLLDSSSTPAFIGPAPQCDSTDSDNSDG
eukprot:2796791-Karenia_brevis.AAC.1